MAICSHYGRSLSLANFHTRRFQITKRRLTALFTDEPLSKDGSCGIRAKAIRKFDLANAPGSVSVGFFDRHRNRAPRTPPATITTLKNGRPPISFQDSREDWGSVVETFVEPEFKILALESSNEWMP